MKNEMSMGSSIIDFYMDGYDEGKDDNVEVIIPRSMNKKTLSKKARVAARRKRAYFKSKNRMVQLNNVAHYDASPEHENVVRGMLRNHQLPIGAVIRCENPCGSSIANKKRCDTANQKMREAKIEEDYDMMIANNL